MTASGKAGNPAAAGRVASETTNTGDTTMRSSADLDSIFLGSSLAGGTLYRAVPSGNGRVWYRHEVRPDGTLDEGRLIFGAPEQQGWRGLAESA